ncbi:MAG TPA: 3-phosphoshikimate 1-carboxyvinyltransferase [Longimicrobiales bacterium]
MDVHVPGDKSITHRALILAALATGRSRVRRPLVGADTRSTAGVLRALGAGVGELGEETVIEGAGLHGLRAADGVLDCGNSGTTARLLMGVLAGFPFADTLTGDASLRSRPMRRVTEPLSRMGATFEELGEPDRLPIRMRGGALRPLSHVSPQASAQVKSALLLAGLTGGVEVTVREPLPSRDHTERMLSRLGVALRREQHADGGASVTLSPSPQLPAFDIEVPGDASSAAFLIAHALLAAPGPVRVRGVGLNPTRAGFLDVVRRMGGRIALENVRESCGEPIGDIIAERSALRGTIIGPAEIPSLVDEVPVLAVLAARAEGTTVVEGAAELRVKESDRIHALVSNLSRIGASVEERPDGLVVHGSSQPLAGTIRTEGDHRIAMAFGVLGAAAGTHIEIDERDVVDVSFPGFWEVLGQVAENSAP